ncbi:MAG TPA: ABC transporter ATP-binding protein [Clostridiales bacterium]|nr:ABC transporter ATP-binding protein [Clostridiales bacterium]
MGKIIKGMGKYGWLYALSVIFVGIQSVCELILPGKMQVIIDEGITKGDNRVILKSGMEMLLFSAVIAFSAVAASLFMSISGSGFAKRMRRMVFVKVINASNNQINQFGTSSLITRTTNDITQLQQFIVMSRLAIFAPFMGLGSVIFAISEARPLYWIILLAIILLLIAVIIFFRLVSPLFLSLQKKLDRINLVLRESLTGVRVVRAFNRIDRDKLIFNNANADLTKTSLKIARIMAVMMPLAMLTMNGITVLVMWVSAGYIDTGTLNIGQMSAFIQYIMHIMFSLMAIINIFVFLPRAYVSIERIDEVLSSENEMKQTSALQKEKAKTGLEFKNVTFSFKGAEKPVLKNISFTAKPGTITAILGSTGSGKSTLIDLIPRFYDVDSGHILLNGVDISQMDISTLRRRIGLVPQQALLFTGTIAENIRYGKPDATDEEVREAARIAMALDFIESKPLKFDEPVSQGGTNLSGGQKQRISIARAIVRRPDIYIFDDSFSALDYKTDAALRKNLVKEIKDAIVLIIAQRVSTVLNADQIIVLSEGEIAGIGTHSELYSSCEVYREIVLSQLSEEEIA